MTAPRTAGRRCRQPASRSSTGSYLRRDPDQLIGVAAGELLEWGWLIGALADWLAQVGAATAADYDEHFAGHPRRESTAWMLDHIAERIGGLLDGDRAAQAMTTEEHT